MKNVFQMIFSKLNSKKIRCFTPENVVNFISMVLSVYLFCRWHFYILKAEIDPEKYYPIAVTERAFNDPVIPGILTIALCVALQWCRVFFILQASRIFGPLIEILISMIVELFKFSAIYLLIFMTFLTAGMVMFFNLPEFQENWKGAIYLFNASLGNFSFETFTFDNSRLDKEYGWVYMILFLILTNIVLINFLIAVLSNRYTVMEGKSTVLYLQNILRIKQVQTEHKHYSALVSSFVPLNLLILPFAPFLILCKNEKLNCMLLYICYSPVVILGVVAFIACNAVLLPFSYLVLVTNTLKYFYLYLRNKSRPKTFRKVSWELTWIVLIVLLGILLLAVVILVDSVVFLISLFEENAVNKHHSGLKKHDDINQKLDKDVYKLLVKVIEEGEDQIDTKTLIFYFRDKMKIYDQVKYLLFNTKSQSETSKLVESNSVSPEVRVPLVSRSSSKDTHLVKDRSDLQDLSQKPPKYILDQYNLLKAFILKNSILPEITKSPNVPESVSSLSLMAKHPLGYLYKPGFLKSVAEMQAVAQFAQLLETDWMQPGETVEPPQKLQVLYAQRNYNSVQSAYEGAI